MSNLNKIQRKSISLIIALLLVLVFIAVIGYCHTQFEYEELKNRIESRNNTLLVISSEDKILDENINVKNLKIVIIKSEEGEEKTIDANVFLNSIQTQNRIDTEKTEKEILLLNIALFLLSICIIIFVILLANIFNNSASSGR